MSKPTSPKAARARDWAALLRALRDEEAAVTPEVRALWLQGKGPDPAPGWDEDYLHALQKALEQRKPDDLLAMLDASVPMSSLLLPVIAEVIRDARHSMQVGQSKLLTARQDETIRRFFDRLIEHFHMGHGEAQLWLAENQGVSVDTIKRSLRRTKPSPR